MDKGNDYARIITLVESSVRTIINIGRDNQPLETAFGALELDMIPAESMEEAVRMAAARAEYGDLVLLSPACASFDLFKSYEDRGEQFKECVREL